MPKTTTLLPFQPATMTAAQLAAVSFLARYHGHTHVAYAYQLRRWFSWCEGNGLDPLVGIQRAHVELYIHELGESGLMDSSIKSTMHGVRGFFRFAHIDGIIPADPAVYARLPKVHNDESRTQGLDRLELIRFLQVAPTITVHHGALAFLLGIMALRASEAAAVEIEDYAETLCGPVVGTDANGYRLHLTSGQAYTLAAVLLPLIREREAAAWEQGRAAERRDWEFTFDLATPDEDRAPWPNPYTEDPEGVV